jgi:hypothetical protein
MEELLRGVKGRVCASNEVIFRNYSGETEKKKTVKELVQPTWRPRIELRTSNKDVGRYR